MAKISTADDARLAAELDDALRRAWDGLEIDEDDVGTDGTPLIVEEGDMITGLKAHAVEACIVHYCPPTVAFNERTPDNLMVARQFPPSLDGFSGGVKLPPSHRVDYESFVFGRELRMKRFGSGKLVAAAVIAALSGLSAAAVAQPEPPVAAQPQDNGSQGSGDGPMVGKSGLQASQPAPPQAGQQQADQWTYPLQGGGMYKPPAVRPASPAQDLNVEGRT